MIFFLFSVQFAERFHVLRGRFFRLSWARKTEKTSLWPHSIRFLIVHWRMCRCLALRCFSLRFFAYKITFNTIDNLIWKPQRESVLSPSLLRIYGNSSSALLAVFAALLFSSLTVDSRAFFFCLSRFGFLFIRKGPSQRVSVRSPTRSVYGQSKGRF